MKLLLATLFLVINAQAENTTVFAKPKDQAKIKRQLDQEIAQEQAQANQNLKQAKLIEEEQKKQQKLQLAKELAAEQTQANQNLKQAKLIQIQVAKEQAQIAKEQAIIEAKLKAEAAALAKAEAQAQAKADATAKLQASKSQSSYAAGMQSKSNSAINTQTAKMSTFQSSAQKSLRMQLAGELATGDVTYAKEVRTYSGFEVKAQAQKDLSANFFAQAGVGFANTTAEFVNGVPYSNSPSKNGLSDIDLAGILHKQFTNIKAFGGIGFGISGDTELDLNQSGRPSSTNNKSGGANTQIMFGAERELANGNTIKGEVKQTIWQDRNIALNDSTANISGADKTEYTATLTRPTFGQTAYGAAVKYINVASADLKEKGFETVTFDQASEWQLTAFANTQMGQTPVKPYVTLVSKNGEDYGDNSFVKLGIQANWQY